MLLKSRGLNISILISATWHIIFIFSITPFLIPEHIDKRTSTISFLGAILGMAISVSDASSGIDKISMMPKIEIIKGIALRDITLSSPDITSKAPILHIDKGSFVFPDDKYKNFVLGRNYRKKETPAIRFRDVVITGPASDRIILYRPTLQRIILLALDASYVDDVTIRFKISKHGFVEMPECIVSSGSSYVDQMAIRYVRKWQFVPIYEDFDSQEGTVRIIF